MPSILCIVGPDDPSRDEWVGSLVGEFKSLGLKVGLISREDAGNGLSLQGGGLCLERPFDSTPGLMELAERFGAGLDLVVSTAHPQEKKLKIAYCPQGCDESIAKDPGVKVLVSPSPLEVSLAWFAPRDVAKVAEFVSNNLLPKKEPAWVTVLLDGKRVPIKGFVQDIIGQSIKGMVGTLRGGDKKGRLEVFIDK